MIAIERRNGILEKLQEDKKVVVGELSQLYKVSEETIRRDLERLEKEGIETKLIKLNRIMAGLCSMRITMWRCRSTSERKAMQQENRKLQS